MKSINQCLHRLCPILRVKLITHTHISCLYLCQLCTHTFQKIYFYKNKCSYIPYFTSHAPKYLPDGIAYKESVTRVEFITKYSMSCCIRKPTNCIGENKGADQLCSNCTADQRLCFRYYCTADLHLCFCYTESSENTIPLLFKSEISSF